jgi:PiT family inorganic phosphate transporter
MHLWGETISFSSGFFLLLALVLALCFECVNGFHDTANAVATVIYTQTLKPVYAVIWSGLWNFVGVVTSSGLVAYGIVAILPHDLIMNIGTGDSMGQYLAFAMFFSLLISAIFWNLGTWYLGLPVSSTHTLVGAILGVGVAHAIMTGHNWTEGLNWEQISSVILALLLSPIVGFVGSALLLLLLKTGGGKGDLFKAPEKGETPPPWIRGTLVATCTGVSFAHGYNDGQKGMGLMMLILIAVLPGAFALHSPSDPGQFKKTIGLAQQATVIFQAQASSASLPDTQTAETEKNTTAAPPTKSPAPTAPMMKPDLSTEDQEVLNQFVKTGKPARDTYQSLIQECAVVTKDLTNLHDFQSLPTGQREAVRKDIYLLGDSVTRLNKSKVIKDQAQGKTLKDFQKSLNSYTQFIPIGVKIAVAFALGLGTMIGWKRVVVTVGEKIGKAHLTYAQGASAELVAFITILGSGLQGWPVSTTHVLSSGIAGTMAANRSGLQTQTLINIVLAWVLTLPVCVFLGATLFSAALYLVFHLVGMHS